jgi:hypothetical protein
VALCFDNRFAARLRESSAYGLNDGYAGWPIIDQHVMFSWNPSPIFENGFHLTATESTVICTELGTVMLDNFLHVPIEIAGAKRVFHAE